ncbi:hypothetical protein [Nocardia sp. NPDC057668]|uniref:hypothetical protein n=1 Tax=Nocardia sp. NPDC057668 TaxID=3346202 RepID=UPI00367204EC
MNASTKPSGSKTLTEWIFETRMSFGRPPGAELVLSRLSALQPRLVASDIDIPRYKKLVDDLNAAADRFIGFDRGVEATIAVTESTNVVGIENLSRLVTEMNDGAQAAYDQSAFVATVLGSFDKVGTILADATGTHQNTANDVDGLTKELEAEKRARAQAEQALEDLEALGTADDKNPPPPDPDRPDRPDQDRPSQPDQPQTPAPPDSPYSPADTGGGFGGMDGLMSMLPLLMQQGAMQRDYDRDLSDRRDRLTPTEPERPREPEPAAAPAPTVSTGTPWSPGSAPAGPAATSTAPVTTTSAANAATQPGAPVPNADGKVLHTFRDSRTAWVSPTVDIALTAAESNNAGTSAQAAYANTPAKWERPEQGRTERPGRPVDPYELVTGDVATWTGRSAIVVLFDTDGDGSLWIIADGALTPFDAVMQDSDGDFGDFAGFAHPNAIDAVASQPGNAAGAAPSDPLAPVSGPAVMSA